MMPEADTTGFDLQVAVRAAVVAALPDWPVFDGAPAGAALPYVTIGPDLVVEASATGLRLRRWRFAVTLWAAGDAVSVLKAGMGAVEAGVVGMVSPGLVEVRFLRAFTRRVVRDGLVRGEVEFEALVEGL